MSENIEEKFNKDLVWVLSELKQEEIANAFSEYKIKFSLIGPSDKEPNFRSQRRILQMLRDREALTLKPFYHNMNILDSVFELQGAKPIGFYIQVLQPQFDNILEEVTKQKPKPVQSVKKKNDPYEHKEDTSEKYFVTMHKRQVVLNNTFVLSSPNFNSENSNFIEYMIEHPDCVVERKDFEDAKQKVKKSFHHVLNDLGFKGEIRKLFFEASKSSVKFRNNVHESELGELGVDKEQLVIELSGLDRIGKKEEEVGRKSEK